MAVLDFLDALFVINAFLFQFALIIHFALRRWRFDQAIRYGPAVYALSIPSVILSSWLFVAGEAWVFWAAGLLYFAWAVFGYEVEYRRKIEWRSSRYWPVFVPYVSSYLAVVMFYWWPLALLNKPLWYGYALLFAVSTILNVTSHQVATRDRTTRPA